MITYDVAMSLKRICDVIVRRNVRFQGVFARRLLATEPTESKNETVDITTADEEPIYLDDVETQKEIAKKRNKSRLIPSDRNILMGLHPFDEPVAWHHRTVRYKKRMLGRYGLKGNNEPVGFAWPTLNEVKDAKEYERVAFPLSFVERMKKLEEEKQRKAEQMRKREDDITEKLAKMEQWTAALQAKIAKKEADLEAARLRKERIVEEIRRHFGFKISPHDARFKEMLEQKEKEEKKKKKEAKKKEKMERFASMLQEKNKASKEQTPSEEQITNSPNLDSTKPVE